MAPGTEIVFELTVDDLASLLPDGDLEHLAALSDARERDYLLLQAAQDTVGQRLRQVSEQLVRARFDPSASWVDAITGVPDPTHGRRLRAQTPLGVRGFGAFAVDGFGPEGDQSQVVGISIWSRYRPVWADWRYPHGGSGDHIRLDDELLTMADVARTALAEVMPTVRSAALTVVSCFY